MITEHNKPKAVDTTRTGEIIFVADDVPLQMILYSVQDVFGNQVYYTEEAEKYITNTKGSRRTQWQEIFLFISCSRQCWILV